MTTPSLFRRATALAAVCLVAGAAAAAVSCLTVESYVYSAQAYDPTADCVHAYAPVELVTGSGASSVCPRTCLTVGDDLYVSTMCPPLPTIATAVPGNDPDCIAAVAAAGRGTCEAPADAGDAGKADAAESDASDGAATTDDAPAD
jgi:hypothetical protein